MRPGYHGYAGLRRVDGVKAVLVDAEMLVRHGHVVADLAPRAAGGLDRPSSDEKFVTGGVCGVAVVLVDLGAGVHSTFLHRRSTAPATPYAPPRRS